MHSNTEGESSEEWAKIATRSDVDVGSEGGQSTDSKARKVRSFVPVGSAERPTWIPAEKEKDAKNGAREADPQGEDAVPLVEIGTAHAPEASAPEGAPEDHQEEEASSPDNMITGRGSKVREMREAFQGHEGPSREDPNHPKDSGHGSSTLDIGEHQVKLGGLLGPSICPLTIDPVSVQPEALELNVAWKDETDPQWTRLRTVMDSGAAESVGPPSMAPGVPIHESPGSRRGQAYIAAGHERILNLGQQVLNVVTNEGQEVQALYQIAEVTRPLTAGGSTCDKGNVVIYGPHGGCILNLESGVQTDFVRRGGIYELDLHLRWFEMDNL